MLWSPYRSLIIVELCSYYMIKEIPKFSEALDFSSEVMWLVHHFLFLILGLYDGFKTYLKSWVG